MNLSASPGRPACPSRHPVGHLCPRLGVSRVAYAFLVYMLSPLPRRSDWAYSFAHSPQPYQPSPKGGRIVLRIILSRLARRSLALRPAHSRCHGIYRDTLTRLQPLCYLHDCSGCFRLQRLPGGTYTQWKAPPFHGAPPKRIFDAHPPDQDAHLRLDLRSPSPLARLPTPVAAKSGSVPTHERLGPDDCENLQDCWKAAIQLDEEPAREPNATTRPAPQDNQLMSKHRVLGFKP
jgi:hypothetical protein